MLCVAVMLSVMVLGAGAAFSDQDQIENTEAVDACSALNIIGGYEDGSFHPERNIKRSEITKMICVALNAGNDPNVSTNAVPTFNDVRGTSAEWAEGYIEACVAQGIVSGVGGGRFNPNGNVTGAQLAKMLLVALGYNAETENFTGNAWETNVNVRAAQKSLYAGLEDMDTSAAVTRDQAAQMVWNAMQAYEVEYKTNLVTDENGNLSTQIVVQDKVVSGTTDKISLLRDKYNALISIGTLVNIDKTDLDISMSAADALASDNPDVENFSKLSKDYSGLLGQKVTVIYTVGKSDKVLGVFASGDNAVYNVIANETSKDDNKVSFGGNSYSIDVVNGGIRTYVDGGDPITTTLAQLDSNYLNPNAYTFVDSDGNGRLDTLIVKSYNVAQVTYAASDKIIAAGQTYKYADENIADGIAVDDWIVITPNLYNDNLDISKVDVQTATLAALRDNRNDVIHFDGPGRDRGNTNYNQYKIGDVWYNAADDVVQSPASENDLKTVKAGESVDYVAVNGIMFSIQKSSGEFNGKVDNVAMITKIDGAGFEDRVKIQLFNGDTDTVTVGERAGSLDYDQLNEGVVYEYTVSGGKYYFEDNGTLADPNNTLKNGIADDRFENYYGDLTYRGDKVEGNGYTVEALKAAATKDTFDGKTIDDSAEVMLFSAQTDAGGNITSVSTTTLTGKQYKSLDLNDVLGDDSDKTLADTDTANATAPNGVGIVAYAFSGTLNGLDRIGALAIQVEDNVNLGDLSVNTWSHYGFILTDASFVGNNNKLITYSILTENGVIDVQEEFNDLNQRTKNTAVGYSDITTSDGTNVINDVDRLEAADGMTFDAITKVSSDKTSVNFLIDGEQDIDDAVILYANTKDGEGVTENGNLSTAVKDANGDYLANALFLKNDLGDIELVIVEQTDWLRSTYYEGALVGQNLGDATADGTLLIYGNDSGVKAVTAPANAFTDNCQVGTAYTETETYTTKNIANGVTPVITTTASIDGLTVTATTVQNNRFTVTVSGNPTVAGTLTFSVVVDGVNAGTVRVTVNANPAGTVLNNATGEATQAALDAAQAGDTVTLTGRVNGENGRLFNTNGADLVLKNATIPANLEIVGAAEIEGTLTLYGTFSATTVTQGADAAIADMATETTAADLARYLGYVDEVSVQAVDGALAASTDLKGKTLTVAGDADLSNVAAADQDADTAVTVNGKATLKAAAELNGTWNIGTIDGATTSLTVAGNLTTESNVPAALTVTSGTVQTGDVTGAVTVNGGTATIGEAKDDVTLTGTAVLTATKVDTGSKDIDTAATTTLTITGDISDAVTLDSTMLGKTVFSGEVSNTVTMDAAANVVEFTGKVAAGQITPANGAATITFAATAEITDTFNGGTNSYKDSDGSSNTVIKDNASLLGNTFEYSAANTWKLVVTP